MQRIFFSKKYARAFTVIELLIVVALIGVLASIVIASLLNYRDKARIAHSIAQIRELQKATLFYYADTGQWPLACDESCTLGNDRFRNAAGVSGWRGPYINAYNLAHGWKGHVGWLGAQDYDQNDGGRLDMLFQLDDDRPQMGSSDNGGQIPLALLQAIDAAIDDGNLATGLARGNGNGFPGGGASGGSGAGELIFLIDP